MTGMGFYQLEKKQHLRASVAEVWDFISSPKNLKEITPGYMGFDIVSENLSEKMYAGMIIAYRVRPVLNIPLLWVTEITHVVENHFFIDEQRIGPYAFWHHQHFVEPAVNGVLMTDIVCYRPPFSILGNIANKLFISRQLESIFSYRQQVLAKRFS
jgi:ligand-binding SRPBCC domain-containing protein